MVAAQVLTGTGSIESMKMETVIRSPQKGVIAKLVHKAGVGLFQHSSYEQLLTFN
jgi:acetyl/propionyl-CoA carboxylase alpha subunit